MSDANKPIRRQVTAGRRLSFYAGYLCMAAGVLFLVWAAAAPFRGAVRFSPSGLRELALAGLSGLTLLFIGGLLRRIGIRGMAGSLLTLDPPQARRDLEPWSRAAGGLADAALSEVQAVRDIAGREIPRGPVVKVRCQSCRALNDEDARYCKGCGSLVT